MFEFPKTLVTEKIWQSLSFGEFFSSLKGGGGSGFVVKLVAAKVILQHLFFFAVTHLLDKNLRNKKKIW